MTSTSAWSRILPSRMTTAFRGRRAAAPVTSTQHIAFRRAAVACSLTFSKYFSCRQANDTYQRIEPCLFLPHAHRVPEAPRRGARSFDTMYDAPPSPILLLSFGRRQAGTAITCNGPCLDVWIVSWSSEAPRSGADSPETTSCRPASDVPMLDFAAGRQNPVLTCNEPPSRAASAPQHGAQSFGAIYRVPATEPTVQKIRRRQAGPAAACNQPLSRTQRAAARRVKLQLYVSRSGEWPVGRVHP
ncbi:hypothetical protein DFH06DRAFT_768467 [Mycena polygramma]|nr:hypothetical protein DFH06DRAFT_768467 [Mycena polygramma]